MCIFHAEDSLFFGDLRELIVLRLKIVVVKEDIEIICQEESRNII